MEIKIIPIGPLQTNCYIVICPQSQAAAIIDPGWNGEALAEYVQTENIQLQAILLTHAHFDHVGGTAALKASSQAPLMAHPDTIPSIQVAHQRAQDWGFEMQPVPEPDSQLVEGQIIEVGTLKLEVLYTPGHAPGHVSYYERSAKAVFDGDVLFSGGIGRTDFPGGDYQTLIQSIRQKLLTLPDDTKVYSGHGPATTIGNEKRWNPFLK